MPDIPFALRLGVLLGFLVVMAGVDRVRHGAEARRWREYLFLLAAGLAGALFALTNDHVTMSISADYFVFGKGLDEDGLRWSVSELAIQAGLGPGLLIGGTQLLVNQPKEGRPVLGYGDLARGWGWPLVFAVACVAVVAPVSWVFDPFGVSEYLEGEVSDARVRRFVLVQGIHTGLYLGAAIGCVVAAVRVHTRRVLLAAPEAVGGADQAVAPAEDR